MMWNNANKKHRLPLKNLPTSRQIFMTQSFLAFLIAGNLWKVIPRLRDSADLLLWHKGTQHLSLFGMLRRGVAVATVAVNNSTHRLDFMLRWPSRDIGEFFPSSTSRLGNPHEPLEFGQPIRSRVWAIQHFKTKTIDRNDSWVKVGL